MEWPKPFYLLLEIDFNWSSGNCLTIASVFSLVSRYTQSFTIWKPSVKGHSLRTVFKLLQTELLNHRIHTFQPLLKVTNFLLSYLKFVLKKLQVGGGQAAQLILLSYGHTVF